MNNSIRENRTIEEIQQSHIKSFFNRYIKGKEISSLENAFKEHCHQFERPLFLTLTHFVLWAVILTWPLEYYFYYDSPYFLKMFNVWRSTAVIISAFILLMDLTTDLFSKFMTELLIGGTCIVTFSMYLSLSQVGGLEFPWFYSSYSLPFATIIMLNLPFLKRMSYTILVSLSPVCGYFILHPEYLSYPYIYSPLMLLGVLTFCSVFIGHVFHNLFKESFVRGQKLSESVREKETLLEEIHHRVKNNLQIVISMLNLQLRERNAQQFKKLFEGTIERIKAMALVHENLYQSDDIGTVNLSSYLESICNHLINIHDLEHEPELNLDIDDIDLDLDDAIACGLIVNELVSNSLQHALDNHPDDRLDVVINQNGERTELIVSDNGVGLNEDFTIEESGSTGMTIVKSLANFELDGDVNYSVNEGTTATISFSKQI